MLFLPRKREEGESGEIVVFCKMYSKMSSQYKNPYESKVLKVVVHYEIFYLGKKRRGRSEIRSYLVESIEVIKNHLVLELFPMQCVKREGWMSGQNDISVFRKSDGAAEEHKSV